MRKKKSTKKILSPDARYNDVVVSRFINNILKKGKKHLARKIVYDAFEIIEKKASQSPLEIFKKALENARPLIEVKARRVGGANYQVPTEVRPDRSEALGIRWLISYAQDRKDKSMCERLASEIFAASNKEGGAVKKREEVHKMAEANKAFAHFRW